MLLNIIEEIHKTAIAEYLITLLNIEKKSELIKFCKDVVITQEDLVVLIHNCYKIGYVHEIKYKDFVPNHLEPTEEERCALVNSKVGQKLEGNALKLVRKVSQIFKERRYLAAHLFINENKWHIFYLDQRDIESSEGNHWKKGAHIHFVNYLWPNLNINNLWSDFDSKNASIGGKLHIRFQKGDENKKI